MIRCHICNGSERDINGAPCPHCIDTGPKLVTLRGLLMICLIASLLIWIPVVKTVVRTFHTHEKEPIE